MYGMGPRGSMGRMDFGVLCPHWPNGFNGLIFKRNVFDSCVFKFEVDVGVYE